MSKMTDKLFNYFFTGIQGRIIKVFVESSNVVTQSDLIIKIISDNTKKHSINGKSIDGMF